MNLVRYMVLCLFGLYCSSLNADLRGEMEKFANRLSGDNGYSNVTGSSLFKGQTRGYINGGNLYIRTPTTNITKVKINVPSYKLGCGGIDAYLGGIQMMSKDQITQAIKAVSVKSAQYLFMGALRSFSPTIASSLSEGIDSLNKATEFLQNSCDAGAWVASSMNAGTPQPLENSRCIRRALDSTGGDYGEAKLQCSSSNGGNHIDDDNVAADQERDFANLPMLGNAVIRLLRMHNMYQGKSNKPIREIIMSLTGTIIVTNDEKIPLPLPPLHVTPNNFKAIINALITGRGEANLYQCDNADTDEAKECTKVSSGNRFIDTNLNIVQQTHNQLLDLSKRMKNRKEKDISQNELDLIQFNLGTVPVARLLAVAALGGSEVQNNLISIYSAYIAKTKVFDFIDNLLGNLKKQAILIKNEADNSDLIKNIDETKRKLLVIRQETAGELNNMLDAELKIQQFERTVLSAWPNRMKKAYYFE
jgi:conjugative transfer pilus assembly protein TraH